tara:strand:+ start:43 stop:480 length:438 start_codon:yes stop_codon:yes gene_type:complete
MANIVLTGNTSGAITIAAPAVAGTNTLTLPASTATLLTTTGDGSGLTGIVEAIGVDQSYTDVTSSRAYNTEYTNSTGKPIFVYTVWTVGTGEDIKFYIGGVTQPGALYTNAASGRGSMSFIVPNGLTYKCDGGGTATLQGWFELR